MKATIAIAVLAWSALGLSSAIAQSQRQPAGDRDRSQVVPEGRHRDRLYAERAKAWRQFYAHGATKAITFDTVSTSPGDYKTIVASCGNTVTAMVVVVDFEVKMEPVEQFEGRNQSALGVGELADLWVETTPSLDPTSLGTWTWERVSGPAVVTGYTDGTATMEAGATAGKVSVKASLLTPLGGKPQARVLQEVGVKIPESVRYEQAPGSKVVHQKGIPSIGMIMYIYLMPSDVSFKRNGQYREGEVPANESVQTGWYAKKYPNGFRHEPWDPVPIMTPKNNEEGNLVKIVDEVASGRGQNDPELNEQNKSEFTWKIPAQFRSGAAAWQTVETITHHSTMHPNGDMDLEKDGVKVSTKINDDTVESYR